MDIEVPFVNSIYDEMRSTRDVGHTVQNVEDMGWRGTKDRELLALADVFPFDVFSVVFGLGSGIVAVVV